jgi:hypothetical protein
MAGTLAKTMLRNIPKGVARIGNNLIPTFRNSPSTFLFKGSTHIACPQKGDPTKHFKSRLPTIKEAAAKRNRRPLEKTSVQCSEL